MFDGALLGFALGAGMLAAFNPCGFALLPAYLGWFLGLDTAAGNEPEVQRPGVLRSLVVGLCVTLGFIGVFAVFALLTRGFSLAVEEALPYITLGLGLLMVPFGLYLAAGKQLKLRIPGVRRGPQDRTLAAVVAFGASYALVSLGCTTPIFIGAVASTFGRDLGEGLAAFVAYSLGTGLVLVSLTLVIGLAKGSLVRHYRRVLPYVGRASGVLLVLTGVYVAYYGWVEYQVLVRGNLDVEAGPVDWVTDRTDELTTWVSETGPGFLAVLIGVALVIAVASVRLRSRGRQAEPSEETPVPH